MFLYDLSDEQKQAFTTIAQEMIRADGNIAEEETYYLALFIEEMGLEEAQAPIEADAALEIFRLADSQTQMKIYMELYALAKCDQDYDENERALMDLMAITMAIPESKRTELEAIVDDFTGLYIRLGKVLGI